MKPEMGGVWIKPGTSEPLRLEPLERDQYGHIVRGKFVSPSGTEYPIENYVPRFVPEHNYADSFGYQWNIHARTQLDSFTGLKISEDRLFSVSGWNRDLRGQKVLEAGSGAGRFTEVLLTTGAQIFSFDYSSAVDANWINNGKKDNLNLFQGDIFNIPFKAASFDKVMCMGVIQHTPDPEKAFISLANQVKPGGELVIDVYASNLKYRLSWQYLLRPLTKHIPKEILYKTISIVVPVLLPFAMLARKLFGKIGARLFPIPEYSNLGLKYDLNKQWSILDAFDIYSPAHDHPQSIDTVKKWYEACGYRDVVVKYGPNGVIGRGVRGTN